MRDVLITSGARYQISGFNTGYPRSNKLVPPERLCLFATTCPTHHPQSLLVVVDVVLGWGGGKMGVFPLWGWRGLSRLGFAFDGSVMKGAFGCKRLCFFVFGLKCGGV